LALTLVFALSILVTVIAVPWVIVRLPEKYFCSSYEPEPAFENYPAPIRLLLIGGKNLLGIALVVAGIAMLVLPGQGVIAVLIGVMLLDFPGKKRMERWLIRRGPVLKFANWLRSKWHKKPFVVD
jgi:hypothetical protein